MKRLKDILQNIAFTLRYEKNIGKGAIREFDENFYSQFDGMYFDGMPIYFLLNSIMSEGRCYDASAVLGLALGPGSYICRGDLSSQAYKWGRDSLGHGWVEKDGYVYDTTWHIICEKGIYEKVFKPVNVNKREYSKFFDDCKEITDWTIRDKTWYEENYSISHMTIKTVRAVALLSLKNPKLSDDERKYWQKLLKDLPDETKMKRPNLSLTKKR